MKKLLNFISAKLMHSLVFTVLLVLGACNKSIDDTPTTNLPATSRTLEASSFAYDYDKYGTMVYNHVSYFNGTFDPSNYLPIELATKFRTEFPEFLRNEQVKYPTIELLLTAYESEGLYTAKSKTLILSHLGEISSYLESSDRLSVENINTFILAKENVILNRADLNDKEKMDVLPMSSIIRNFLKLKHEQYLASKVTGGALSRGDCPWYKVAACLAKLGYAAAAATKFASIGIKVGVSLGAFAGPPGILAGAIIGGAIGATVGVLIYWKDLKDCKEACIDTDDPVIPTGDPCKGATDLAIKINGCGLTQEFVATGQGANVNTYQGPVLGATVSNIISSVPNFFLTQSNQNTPITVALLSGCANTQLYGMGKKVYNISSIVGDPGFVDILGPRMGCLQGGDCYTFGGSFLNNTNNTISIDIPTSSNYTYTQVGNEVCFDWKKEGTYTFSATITNSCFGATRTESITVEVKKGICQ